MAAGNVTSARLEWNTAGSMTQTAADTTEGAVVSPGADESTVLVLTSSGALTATVQSGDGIQGTGDLTVSFTAAGTKYLALESGKYKQTRGANAGKIIVKTSAAGLTVGCLILPR